ncbi:MAG TPA: hypothetical protein VN703_04430, partial [Candidatus Sulfopaludibacter sp.]|nr:hypothetical protein [Candidatus Sulfopaludibacter sp.]
PSIIYPNIHLTIYILKKRYKLKNQLTKKDLIISIFPLTFNIQEFLRTTSLLVQNILSNN